MGFLSRLGLGSDGPATAPDGNVGAVEGGNVGSVEDGSAGSLSDTRFRLEVEAVLDEVRPALHSDGGDIELVGIVGRSIRVRMTGACHGCASANFTLRLGIEKRLRDAIPEFEDLIPV